jgi:uncharacterized protein YgiM (DUF1202 family)
VFGLDLWWSIGASVAIVIFSFLFTKHVAFKNGARPVQILIVLTLATAGTIYFLSSPELVKTENPLPVEMTTETATEIIATVTSDALNFRASPSGSGELIKALRKGDTLTVTGEPTANGWMPVEHAGDAGYVSAEFISVSASSVESEPEASNTGDAATSVFDKINFLRLLSTPFVADVQTKIHSLGFVSFPFAILGFLICFNIFRSRKYKYKSPIIKVPVFIIGCLLIAFISIKAMPLIRGATTAQTVTVTANAINMRSAPSTSGSIIKTLKRGDTLKLTGPTTNGWAPVKHGINTGYVSADLISVSGTPVSPPATAGQQATVTQPAVTSTGEEPVGDDAMADKEKKE